MSAPCPDGACPSVTSAAVMGVFVVSAVAGALHNGRRLVDHDTDKARRVYVAHLFLVIVGCVAYAVLVRRCNPWTGWLVFMAATTAAQAVVVYGDADPHGDGA